MKAVFSLVMLLSIIGCQATSDQSAKTTSLETQELTLPEGTLAYDDQGQGPLIVMMPGLGDLRQSYRFLTPELVAAGYRVVTVDLRGHGESSVPWPEYSTAAISNDLRALIAHLDAGPAVVVGNSFSAGVAAWAATEEPESVAGIAMIGPFVRDHGKPSWLMRSTMAVLFNGPWRVRAWTWFHGTLFSHEQPADYDNYSAQLHANLSERHRFNALKEMMNKSPTEVAELEARLSQVNVPALVLMGSADPDFPDPKAEADWVAKELNGTVALIDKAGHYPQAEMPEETARALLQFIAPFAPPLESRWPKDPDSI